MANFTPNQNKYKNLTPFKSWLLLQINTWGQNNFPFVESDFDELTNYGMMQKLMNAVNDVISNENLVEEDMTNLFNAYTELQNYVNNYFDNLDVQDEINRKLDEMAESGQLQDLLKLQYNELETDVNNKMNIISNALLDKLEQQDVKIDSATSGSPLVASSTSGMTDTSKIYVNTTDGKWYYYNGTTWTIGGTYQGTSVSSSDPTFAELNARLNQYMDYYYFNESESFSTPFEIKVGQVFHLVVTSLTGHVNLFTVGASGALYMQLHSTGVYEISVTSNGAMRFYFPESANIQGYCYIESKMMDLITDSNKSVTELKYNYIANAPSLNDIQLRKNIVYNNFENLTNKSYNFDSDPSNATIENYINYEVSSSVGLPTPVIRVRNNDGNLIYNDLTISGIDNITSGQQATAMWTFDINGKYKRVVKYYEFKTREEKIANDEYYVILNKYPTAEGYTSYDWVINSVSIDWLNNNQSKTYVVGTGKDFETFTDMLRTLQNDDSNKIVYVEPGEYNIFEEMGGASYMASLVGTASNLNWRDVNYVVPSNTKIIGLGEVKLTWLASQSDMQSQAVAFLFSPLNVSGNCYIENINVIAQNCRYALHDETSGLPIYDGSIHEFKNCNFIFNESYYGVQVPYGAGHNKNMKIKFDNCSFISYRDRIWSTHDWNYAANSPALIELNNCIFRKQDANSNTGYINLISADTIGKKDIVKFNNCYIKGYILFGSSQGQSINVRQGYDVTLIGCSRVNTQYEETVTTHYDINQYNSFN